MTPSRAGIRRRLIGLFMILGFGFFTAESLIADVCDGDSGLARAGVIDGGDQGPGSGGPAQAPGHSMHVCHCAHAHGGMPALTDRVASAPELVCSAVAFIATTPPSRALEPQLRPPIA